MQQACDELVDKKFTLAFLLFLCLNRYLDVAGSDEVHGEYDVWVPSGEDPFGVGHQPYLGAFDTHGYGSGDRRRRGVLYCCTLQQ